MRARPEIVAETTPPPDVARDNARGAAIMSLSMAGFVLNDALVKLSFDTLPIYQAILIRGVFATLLLTVLAWRRGVLRPQIARADRSVYALRTASEIGATICFLTALSRMPLANATAILQTLPLTITMGAALLYRERVGWRRWSAIVIGFAGVAIMLRPGPEGFDADALWALGAVGFVTARDLLTRKLSAGAPSVFVALLTAAAITMTGALGALTQPLAPVSAQALGLLFGAALFLLVAYIAAVNAVRVGEIGFVAPFRYSVLIWALFLGWALFGELPDATTLAGAGVVVGTGLYTLHRERLAARRR